MIDTAGCLFSNVLGVVSNTNALAERTRTSTRTRRSCSKTCTSSAWRGRRSRCRLSTRRWKDDHLECRSFSCDLLSSNFQDSLELKYDSYPDQVRAEPIDKLIERIKMWTAKTKEVEKVDEDSEEWKDVVSWREKATRETQGCRKHAGRSSRE